MSWRSLTFAVWGLLGGLLVGCQVLAVRARGRLPTAGMLVRVGVGGRVGRALLVVGWMWLGWHAFAR
jgi:hypothetical protein